MEIYLIRHAEAVPANEGETDADRPLTPDGELQAVSLARAFEKHDIKIDVLVCSPLLRARQTAEILVKEWGRPEFSLIFSDELKPKVKPRRLSKFLLKQSAERIGLVGHMPMLGETAAWLAGSKKVQIDLAKAGFIHLSCGDFPSKGHAAIQSVLTPEWY